jgi:uncharacterized membrane protein YeaQ/YmgE (transglycosylase-associated protein family)
MDIITCLIVGLVAGVLASAVVGNGYGLIGDIIVGMVGSVVGSWAFQGPGWSAPFEGLAGAIFVAFVGAVLILFLLRVVARYTHTLKHSE